MSLKIVTTTDDTFSKAKDLVVKVRFENDSTPEGKLRLSQAKEIICQLILLGQKKGRPVSREEILDEVA
ncbi:MAG: hypothetical protein L6Q37_07875 [Bdellovibrionaceae bacterium]|nr:hypothetical protein [Pseudobdellovibrionaceae bacterium]NUM60195.1 hypothetical protein [Pseudobdellovibrionaceae bacterium]